MRRVLTIISAVCGLLLWACEKPQQEKPAGRNGGGNRAGGAKSSGTGNNRFKNFEERSYNYEDLVWEGMRKRQKGGSGDGTQ